MSKNLFITGTGTDVGKTYVAGLIVKKLRAGKASAAYYKAAMSGNERRTDSDPRRRLAGENDVRDRTASRRDVSVHL